MNLQDILKIKSHANEINEYCLKIQETKKSITITNPFGFSLAIAFSHIEDGVIYLDCPIDLYFGLQPFVRKWYVNETEGLEKYLWYYAIPVFSQLHGPYNLSADEIKTFVKNFLKDNNIESDFYDEKKINIIDGLTKPLQCAEYTMAVFNLKLNKKNTYGIGVQKNGSLFLLKYNKDLDAALNYFWYQFTNVRSGGLVCLDDTLRRFIDFAK